MRMDRARADGPVVAGMSPQGFRVDENVYRALTLTPQRADGWTPPPLVALDEAALAAILTLDPKPEFLLLGTGATLVRPPPPFVAALTVRGIGLEAMDSRAAARAWGVLRGEGRWIVAAFYPIA
ncbi:MAG: Mth938-like domain-containing protein [Sphingomonas sp.]|uniref:Mth938-like domain-containing protein n=1 Tax=Sphingomonas sp. TaxID=28214 RepID=UPI001AC016C6|nr:Mth938-like domain-containing protein [Sphingomonas sp.]MBN8806663.1 Mth938-like domain-containing protein [Sphingomonas sp.]